VVVAPGGAGVFVSGVVLDVAQAHAGAGQVVEPQIDMHPLGREHADATAGQEREPRLQQVFGADSAGVTTTPAASSPGRGGMVQVLEYGVDGDHAWMKATVGDIVGGAARAACARLGPFAPLCNKLVDLIIQWYENNNPTHGVWGEIYNTGQVRIGTW